MTIRNTGKLALKDKCKLTTRDITIKRNNIRDMETYLPESNRTLLRDQKNDDK